LSERRITVVSQYFWPENFVINSVVGVLKNFAPVTVICGQPTYKQKIDTTLPPPICESEIFRLSEAERGEKKVLLILNYISFPLSLAIFLLRKKYIPKDKEVIFCYLPSPFVGCFPIIFLKKFYKNIKVVLWVQDIWPDTLKNYFSPLTFKAIQIWLLPVVKIMLRKSDLIFSTSKQSRCRLIELAGDKDIKKFRVLYNPWIVSGSSEAIKRPTLSVRLNVTKIFRLVFTGNLGEAQNLEYWIRVIHIERPCNIRISVFGSGRAENRLKALVKSLQLGNQIKFYGSQRQHRLDKLVPRYDIALLSLSSSESFSTIIPSKVQFYLSCGLPIVGSGSSASLEFFNDENIPGVVISDSEIANSRLVFKFLQGLTPSSLLPLKIRAREVFETRFTVEKVVDQLRNELDL
jgi:colanic acid biosynthesis glycosyl transferase WcaI